MHPWLVLLKLVRTILVSVFQNCFCTDNCSISETMLVPRIGMKTKFLIFGIQFYQPYLLYRTMFQPDSTLAGLTFLMPEIEGILYSSWPSNFQWNYGIYGVIITKLNKYMSASAITSKQGKFFFVLGLAGINLTVEASILKQEFLTCTRVSTSFKLFSKMYIIHAWKWLTRIQVWNDVKLMLATFTLH
jgi:hypothetical protein